MNTSIVSSLIALVKDQASPLLRRTSLLCTLVTDRETRWKIIHVEFQLVFISPEVLFLATEWRRKLSGDLYRKNLVGFFIDVWSSCNYEQHSRSCGYFLKVIAGLGCLNGSCSAAFYFIVALFSTSRIMLCLMMQGWQLQERIFTISKCYSRTWECYGFDSHCYQKHKEWNYQVAGHAETCVPLLKTTIYCVSEKSRLNLSFGPVIDKVVNQRTELSSSVAPMMKLQQFILFLLDHTLLSHLEHPIYPSFSWLICILTAHARKDTILAWFTSCECLLPQ